MSVKPKLSDLLDGLEMVSTGGMEDCSVYLDKITGKVCPVVGLELAEIEDSLFEDDQEAIDENAGSLPTNWRDEKDIEKRSDFCLRAIAEDDGSEFVCLPESFDINDYSIIEDFCYSLENDKVRETMLRIIKGSGAFGRFRQHIRKHGIENDWYAFEREAYLTIIKDWCEAEKIEYLDDLKEKE